MTCSVILTDRTTTAHRTLQQSREEKFIHYIGYNYRKTTKMILK